MLNSKGSMYASHNIAYSFLRILLKAIYTVSVLADKCSVSIVEISCNQCLFRWDQLSRKVSVIVGGKEKTLWSPQLESTIWENKLNSRGGPAA